jgi:hypothetical protein
MDTLPVIAGEWLQSSPERKRMRKFGFAGIATGLLAAIMMFAAGKTMADVSLVEAGRQIYEDGILPGGKPLRALRPEGFEVEGSYAACVSCHRRSGMGSVEGSGDSTVLVPPVAGPVLFKPALFADTYLNPLHHYVPNKAWGRAMTRPGYDSSSLARALREGIDPAGVQLVAPMPLYDLDDGAVNALTAYLQQLSSEPDPGVESDTLHLATVVTPDVRPDRADAVLDVLQKWSAFAHGADLVWRTHVWTLTGPSSTWSQQLDERYREQPVFAMLSGIGGSEWRPVQRFCEKHRVPCVLPSVEVAPDPGSDWYSMYFSPGVGLEARILARYLSDEKPMPAGGAKIIQVYSDATGRYATDIFKDKFGDADGMVSRRRFRVTSPQMVMSGVTSGDILVLWLRPDEIAQLIDAAPQGPPAKRVFISALLATPDDLALPPEWKQRVSFVSLFDDIGLQGEIAKMRLERWLEQEGLASHHNRMLQADAYAACYLFNDALAKMHRQEVRRPAIPLNREHLLESLETLVNKLDDSTDLVDPDGHVAWYGRMSLGPRQRVAVHGGTIMRYASPGASELVPVGRRIVP